MHRQQSGVVTLILRSAWVAAYFLFCGKRFAIRVHLLGRLNRCFQTSPGFMEHSESPNTEVLSHLVSHSCVAGVGLGGEIGFDVIAFIVWENLLCRVYFFPIRRVSPHICWSVLASLMRSCCFFFPACYQSNLPQYSVCHKLYIFGLFWDVTDVGTYARKKIVLLWSLISSPNSLTLTEVQRSNWSGDLFSRYVAIWQVTAFQTPGIFSAVPFLWCELPPGISRNSSDHLQRNATLPLLERFEFGSFSTSTTSRLCFYPRTSKFHTFQFYVRWNCDI